MVTFDHLIHPERAAELLCEEPAGSYLLEQTLTRRILWRITGEEPADEVLDPAPLWALGQAVG